jgi:hypothetical protein
MRTNGPTNGTGNAPQGRHFVEYRGDRPLTTVILDGRVPASTVDGLPLPYPKWKRPCRIDEIVAAVGVMFASATYLMATGAAGVLLTGSESVAAGPLDAPPLAVVDVDRAAGNKVSRDLDRTSVPAPGSSSAASAATASAAQAVPPPPAVAGLDEAQTGNAALIVAVAQRRGLPRRAMVVARSRPPCRRASC